MRLSKEAVDLQNLSNAIERMQAGKRPLTYDRRYTRVSSRGLLTWRRKALWNLWFDVVLKRISLKDELIDTVTHYNHSITGRRSSEVVVQNIPLRNAIETETLRAHFQARNRVSLNIEYDEMESLLCPVK